MFSTDLSIIDLFLLYSKKDYLQMLPREELCSNTILSKLNINITELIDTHREKAPSTKTPARTKSINIDIWVVCKSNQLFIRSS